MSKIELPVFDCKAACPKCNCFTIKTIYYEAESFFGDDLAEEAMPEHMLRICSRCGYSWKEAPLDKPIDKKNNKET